MAHDQRQLQNAAMPSCRHRQNWRGSGSHFPQSGCEPSGRQHSRQLTVPEVGIVEGSRKPRLSVRPHARHHAGKRRIYSRDRAGAERGWVPKPLCCLFAPPFSMQSRSRQTTRLPAKALHPVHSGLPLNGAAFVPTQGGILVRRTGGNSPPPEGGQSK